MDDPPKQLQKTFAMIKPDAVAAGRASEIMQIIELSGFTIIAKEHLQVRVMWSVISTHSLAWHLHQPERTCARTFCPKQQHASLQITSDTVSHAPVLYMLTSSWNL
jgi:hypothetical protein